MDISIQDWPNKLHPLLAHISNALFVAIDFEISGISMKTGSNDHHNWQQHSLQQRYEAVKLAAEKYQILQVGITTVIHDERNGGYILRPYNIHLSPLIKEPLGIDRSFSMQSSSMAFLQNHEFKIEKPFAVGIPYLSHYEERLARIEQDKLNRKVPHPDFFSTICDPVQRVFLTKVRTNVTEWFRLKIRPSSLDIKPELCDPTRQSSHSFTHTERQLIHQFVGAEFPQLTCHNQQDYIRVQYRVTQADATVTKHNTQIFEAKLQRQIGLRYLFDGMMPGTNLENLDILSCFSPTTAPQTYADKQRVLEQFNMVKWKLQRPTMLVGHNVFTDLVNFHACFLGPLPARVEDFQKQISRCFPLVVDTKYLAAQLGNTTGFRSSLREIDYKLKDMLLPRVECHAHHPRYASEQHFTHEAGYDSYITARIFIKLSAKLEAKHNQKTDSLFSAQPEHSVAKLTKSSPDPDAKREKSCLEELAAAFGMDLGLNFSSTQESSDETSQIDSMKTTQVDSIETLDSLQHSISSNSQVLESIPGFESQFWQTFGNRLMVNGTIESVCHL